MLELTILKVFHEGLSEARRIEPCVKQCDVYSPENAACTEAESRGYENLMQFLYSLSLSAFRKESEQRVKHQRPEQRDYTLKLNEFLFKAKKPVYCLERFSLTESFYLRSKKDGEENLLNESGVIFGRGDVDGGLRAFWAFVCLSAEVTRFRDQHMAKTLEKAEAEIRARYASLRTKEPLRLTLGIGGLHSPEIFIDTKVCKPTVIYMDECSANDPLTYLTRAVYEGKTNFEECRHKLLAIYLVANNKITPGEAANKSYEELKRTLLGR